MIPIIIQIDTWADYDNSQLEDYALYRIHTKTATHNINYTIELMV
jgi:hypothetical protein